MTPNYGIKVRTPKFQNFEKIVRSDYGKEFENSIFTDFCNKHGISHEFSSLKTPQKNGVVERKNHTLQE